jgi:NAD binding domain of 6-phosphogluconate dehydrogenase
MAASLLKAGHEVIVYNRTPAKAEPLIAQGARAVASIADACQEGAVITMLANTSPHSGVPRRSHEHQQSSGGNIEPERQIRTFRQHLSRNRSCSRYITSQRIVGSRMDGNNKLAPAITPVVEAMNLRLIDLGRHFLKRRRRSRQCARHSEVERRRWRGRRRAEYRRKNPQVVRLQPARPRNAVGNNGPLRQPDLLRAGCS